MRRIVVRSGVYVWMKNGAQWAGKHWQPLTAILALFVSAWTGYATQQSIELASAGVALAKEALSEQNRSNKYDRYPSISFGFSDGSISLKNDGLGPAYVYQISIESGGQVWTIDRRHSDVDKYRLVAGAIKNSIDLFGIVPLRGSQIPFHYSNPLRVIAPNEEVVFAELKNANFIQEPIRYFESIRIRICYTNLLGEFELQSVSSRKRIPWLSRCPKAPEPREFAGD